MALQRHPDSSRLSVCDLLQVPLPTQFASSLSISLPTHRSLALTSQSPWSARRSSASRSGDFGAFVSV